MNMVSIIFVIYINTKVMPLKNIMKLSIQSFIIFVMWHNFCINKVMRTLFI